MSTDNLKTWPEKIWLQAHDEDEELPSYAEMQPQYHDITWCEDSVMRCEVPYVRADLVPALPTMEEIAFLIADEAMKSSFKKENPYDAAARAILALLEKSR